MQSKYSRRQADLALSRAALGLFCLVLLMAPAIDASSRPGARRANQRSQRNQRSQTGSVRRTARMNARHPAVLNACINILLVLPLPVLPTAWCSAEVAGCNSCFLEMPHIAAGAQFPGSDAPPKPEPIVRCTMCRRAGYIFNEAQEVCGGAGLCSLCLGNSAAAAGDLYMLCVGGTQMVPQPPAFLQCKLSQCVTTPGDCALGFGTAFANGSLILIQQQQQEQEKQEQVQNALRFSSTDTSAATESAAVAVPAGVESAPEQPLVCAACRGKMVSIGGLIGGSFCMPCDRGTKPDSTRSECGKGYTTVDVVLQKKVQSTVGTRKGRSNRSLGLGPNESHAARELMGPDASPNLRVWQMFDEAATFDHRLEGARDLLEDFEHATDGLAEPTRATISHRHAHSVGGDASQAGLEEARGEFHNRLRGHIIRPLEQWSDGLAAVEERLPELVKLRGRVVKTSRNLARYNSKGLFGSCMHPRAGHGGGRRHRDSGSDYSSDDDVSEVDSEVARQVASEEAGMKLNYKHRKLDAARGDYNELEQLVAGQLAGLARDASWLKSYLVSSMLLGKEAMQMAVVALGTTKQPLPGFTGRAAAPKEHGEMGYNYDLAAAMPPELPSMRHDQGGWGLQLLPHIADTGLSAHKATASPLELSAVPTAQAMQPVTPIPESAAGIRMSDIAHTSAVREYEAGARGGIGSQRGASGTAGGVAAAVGPVAAGAGREELQQQQHMGYESSTATGGMHMGRRSGAALGGRGDVDEHEGAGYRSYEHEGAGYRSHEHDSSSDRGVMGAIKDAAGSVASAVGLGGGSTEKGVTHREDYSDIDAVGSRDQGRTAGRGMAAAGDGDYSSDEHRHAHGSQPVLRAGPGGDEVVCGRKEFSQVEDRPIVKERVTRVLEHQPVQKEFVTQVTFAGEQALPSDSRETLGTPETRIVETTPPGPKCPQGMRQHGITA
ncbi:hypothetical protein COO60DRAFT_1462911 [Scenedesmus sp. NREL 46B-D3]|nr:hypothetical protein COO60DRAFT_1462911 [Scenedesmus sp. NREL 46B-D3]